MTARGDLFLRLPKAPPDALLRCTIFYSLSIAGQRHTFVPDRFYF